MTELLYSQLSYAVIGAAIEVHKILGPNFLERVYQAALAQELRLRDIPFEEFRRLPVTYKGHVVGDYEADMVIDNKIIVELKASATLHPKHYAQAKNYLAATGLRVALVFNFGNESLQHKRIIV